jgi:hypothetical protein
MLPTPRADVTFIKTPPAAGFRATVLIQHDGVTFGDVGRGFTVSGGSAVGVLTTIRTDDAENPLSVVAGIRRC